jgi:type II secretory pathway pseudopilin PulG
MGLRTSAHEHSSAEDGYVLLAVMILVAVIMIGLASALPLVKRDIQRDQEIETMHRGHQYVRAIQLYYRKFHRYPPSIDALTGTNGLRFLRKRYDDPITRQDDWQAIPFGQNKAPLSMGFFGTPLNMGAAIATSGGMGGGNGIVGASPISGSSFTNSGVSGDQGSSTSDGTTDSGGSSSPWSGSAPGAPILTGQGIIGFTLASPKPSILVYKTKSRYNEWEFVYDPVTDALMHGMPPPPGTGLPPYIGAPGMGPSMPVGPSSTAPPSQ